MKIRTKIPTEGDFLCVRTRNGKVYSHALRYRQGALEEFNPYCNVWEPVASEELYKGKGAVFFKAKKSCL